MDIPVIGSNVAQKKRPFLKKMAVFFLSRKGWTFSGNLPDIKQMVLVGAPHTSNWDFIYTLAIQYALGFQANWIGKHTIFAWPFGGLMKRMGGIPVNRKYPGNFLRETLARFRENPRFILAIAPEGTRSKVKNWKTGFYRVAHEAQVPIVPICLDFKTRTVKLGKGYMPAGNMRAEIAKIREFYAGAEGKNPQLG